MGDFNVPTTNDRLFKAITSKGLEIPRGLRGVTHGTNLAKDKRYDQILHYPNYPENFSNEGGVLDFYDDDHEPLFPGMAKTAFTCHSGCSSTSISTASSSTRSSRPPASSGRRDSPVRRRTRRARPIQIRPKGRAR
jgi:hypothetical protein